MSNGVPHTDQNCSEPLRITQKNCYFKNLYYLLNCLWINYIYYIYKYIYIYKYNYNYKYIYIYKYKKYLFGPNNSFITVICISAKKLPHIAFASEWGVILVVESINIVSKSKKQGNIKKKLTESPNDCLYHRLFVFHILETRYKFGWAPCQRNSRWNDQESMGECKVLSVRPVSMLQICLQNHKPFPQ